MEYSTAVKIVVKMDIVIKEAKPYKIRVLLKIQDPVFLERLQQLSIGWHLNYYFRRIKMPYLLVYKRFYFSQMVHQPESSFSLEDMLNETGEIFCFKSKNDAQYFSEELKEFLK